MRVDIDKCPAFFFDFDGVIVDSVNIKTEAFAEIYRPFGEEVASKVVSHHLSHGGISRFEKFRHYHENYLNRKISKSELDALAQKFSDLVDGKVVRAPFINGALEFLELLRSKGRAIFVISATPENELKRIIAEKNLSRYFTDIKGAPSDKKDNLSYFMKKYDIKASGCVYFGDSKQDLSAASSLGINFIPVNYFDGKGGYRDFVELMKDWGIKN